MEVGFGNGRGGDVEIDCEIDCTLVPRASRSEPLLVKVRKAASSMFGMP